MTKKHENDTPANARGDEWIIIDGIRYVKVHMGEEASCAKCDLYTMQQETCLDNDLGCDTDKIYLLEYKLPKYETSKTY